MLLLLFGMLLLFFVFKWLILFCFLGTFDGSLRFCFVLFFGGCCLFGRRVLASLSSLLCRFNCVVFGCCGVFGDLFVLFWCFVFHVFVGRFCSLWFMIHSSFFIFLVASGFYVVKCFCWFVRCNTPSGIKHLHSWHYRSIMCNLDNKRWIALECLH